MNIQELEKLYAQLPQVSALAKEIGKSSVRTIFLEGLLGSSAPMVFGSMATKSKRSLLFILQDAEEAGYFYHDLTQLMGSRDVLFFPSSYRRAIKYAQRDPASEILRTEVLSRLNGQSSKGIGPLYIVSYPEALAEMVVSKKSLDTRTLVLEKDQTIAVADIEKTLREFGFREVDYVYEPGQFAQRGSILDVYSFSCEYPYRIDATMWRSFQNWLSWLRIRCRFSPLYPRMWCSSPRIISMSAMPSTVPIRKVFPRRPGWNRWRLQRKWNSVR